MRELAARQLLELWERGASCGPHERALHMLHTALPGHAAEDLAEIDLGLRDWYLLRLHHAWFGPILAARGLCPSCAEEIEIELDARLLQGSEPPCEAPLYIDGQGRRYRLPNSQDLISVADISDIESAARALFEACQLDPGKAGPSDIASIEDGLSALVSERGIELALQCELCGECWSSTFDPAAFFWEEIESQSHRLLDEVHLLASAYGWNEREILSLGTARRCAYLERVL